MIKKQRSRFYPPKKIRTRQQWREKRELSDIEVTKARWHDQTARISSKVEFLILYIVNGNTLGILDMESHQGITDVSCFPRHRLPQLEEHRRQNRVVEDGGGREARKSSRGKRRLVVLKTNFHSIILTTASPSHRKQLTGMRKVTKKKLFGIWGRGTSF